MAVGDSREKRLANWIRRQLLGLPKVERFELVHGAGEFASVLLHLARDAEKAEGSADKRADQIAADVLEAALDAQEALGGDRQTFRLRAFAADVERGATPISVSDGKLTAPDAAARFETPEFDGKNGTAILMAMVQNMHKSSMAQSVAITEPLVRAIDRLAARNEKLEDAFDRTRLLREELETEKWIREQQGADQNASRGRIDRLWQKATGLLGDHIDGKMKALPATLLDAYQARVREVLAALPVFEIAPLLSDDGKKLLNRLLGMGKPFESDADLKLCVRGLWGALNDRALELVTVALEKPENKKLADDLQKLIQEG